MVETVGPRRITLKIIHLAWWLALAASLALLFASLPGYWNAVQMPETAPALAVQTRAGAWLSVVFSLSAAALSLGLAALLFWRKPGDGMALFLSFYLLMNGVIQCGPLEFAVPYWLPQSPYLGLQIQGNFFALPALVLLLIFPNGHFVPRWTWLLVPIAAVVTLLSLLLEAEESVRINTLRALVLSGMLYSLLLLALGIQVYRYRTLYTPLERQQIKWVAYGTLVYVFLLAPMGVLYYYMLNRPPDAPRPWWEPLLIPIWWISLNIFPLSLTVAILRSHLWDIDVILRRTVLYALVTITLTFIYFGSVIFLQRVFSIVTGVAQNEIVTVLSTLAIAALFVPLRNGLQNVIDKRFNRRKFDAQQVLQEFATTVRDETDLERLTARLMQVVDETMQPKSVSVWLRDSGTVLRSRIGPSAK